VHRVEEVVALLQNVLEKSHNVGLSFHHYFWHRSEGHVEEAVAPPSHAAVTRIVQWYLFVIIGNINRCAMLK
jgi:hypothetical protein